MNAKFVYNIPYVKEVLGYLLIPFLSFIVIGTVMMMIYSFKNKDKDSLIYKYKMNLGTLIISTLLVAALFAVLVGFALSFKKQADANGIKSFVVTVVVLAPVLPFCSLLALLYKTIKLIKNKPNKYIDRNNNEKEEIISYMDNVQEDNEPVSYFEDTTNIETAKVDEIIEDDIIDYEIIEDKKEDLVEEETKETLNIDILEEEDTENSSGEEIEIL